MQTIGTPLQSPDLLLSPEQVPGSELSKQMMQAIALIMGYCQNMRVPIKCTPIGSLWTCSPQLQDIVHVTADQDAYVYQGPDVQCSEVMVMGHPNNADLIWARSKTAALSTNAWPLANNAVIGFTISNLSMLHLHIVKDTEIAIVAYTL